MRRPCSTCPWRKSTPKRGFPGGYLDVQSLRRMVDGGPFARAMQCHCTPNGADAQVCVGFALQVGFDCASLRLAALVGKYDPAQVETDEPLHTLEGVIRTHGGHPHA